MAVSTLFSLLSVMLLAMPALAQSPAAPADTLRRQNLDEVVVTATRTEQLAAESATPVTVVGAKTIQAMGSLRLGDVLNEQTGLQTVADHGQGLQIQGLGAAYTLVLVDGEPVIGRTAGTLDLTRLAVGNLKRVEVVKGPASALWGSDALAGVVNLITQTPTAGVGGTLKARYGSNNTADLSATGSGRWGKLGLTAFADRYSSGGYTLGDAAAGATVPAFANYTAQGKLSYYFSPQTRLTVTGRYFVEHQQTTMTVVGEGGGIETVSYAARQLDYSLNPVLTHRFGADKFLATARLYYAGYRTKEDYTYAVTGAAYDATFFNQTFGRGEGQLDWRPTDRHTLTAGGGYLRETVEATRYEARQTLRSAYGFVQEDWHPLRTLSLLAGARFDGNSQYPGQLSPKVAGRWEVVKWGAVRASVGRGYRAPDFRQLYLDFTNPAVGYSVFGTHVAGARVAQLAAAGLLVTDPATGLPVVNAALLAQAGALRPESSTAYNLGVQLMPTARLTASAGVFRNQLKDQIDTRVLAQKANGQSVFSYYNLDRTYTQGADADVRYELLPGLALSAGYQFLIAKDESVDAALAAGTVFRRDVATLNTERVPAADYGGLFNRSRHSANAKIFYDNAAKGFSASLRVLFRGRYGFQDLNGNGILDIDREYVPGYAVCNLAASQTWRRYTLQIGADNLLSYTNPTYISTLPGRLLYASLAWQVGHP